jgi:hypothetical protein
MRRDRTSEEAMHDVHRIAPTRHETRQERADRILDRFEAIADRLDAGLDRLDDAEDRLDRQRRPHGDGWREPSRRRRRAA